MKKTFLLIIPLLFLQIDCFPQGSEVYPNRIVSLSPGITEILYELGLGDRVVGVTNYCKFPLDARNKAKVGGYLDTNYEAVILLKPDLVIVPTDYGEEIVDVFDRADIEYMTVNTLTVDSILNSIEEIGQRCGVEDRAKEVIVRIHRDIDNLRKKVKEKPFRRVMIVVGRNSPSFENLYIAGKKTFYDELLSILGCENAYTKSDISYPAISIEGILRLNPDIIIEMLPDCPDMEKSRIIAEWHFLKDVNAVENNKVYVFNEDYVCIPGPRFILILKELEKVL